MKGGIFSIIFISVLGIIGLLIFFQIVSGIDNAGTVSEEYSAQYNMTKTVTTAIGSGWQYVIFAFAAIGLILLLVKFFGGTGRKGR